ncbi:hypothetical protein QYE76_064099 [Lolium multiflorum]|uniref:Uncharacterized protein n=1 Tax=Lolium multiflorum TaxID=4521 RepID=A0AAD8W9P9_LOLMU|nr:hypothetical protein QYE76_064099 [Lolium multiflorum]
MENYSSSWEQSGDEDGGGDGSGVDGEAFRGFPVPAVPEQTLSPILASRWRRLGRKGWSITENELNAYIEREGHRAREGTEEAEEHPDSSSDAASSSYQHYGHVEPPRHSSAQGPYYHSMYDPPAWNSDPRWE